MIHVIFNQMQISFWKWLTINRILIIIIRTYKTETGKDKSRTNKGKTSRDKIGTKPAKTEQAQNRDKKGQISRAKLAGTKQGQTVQGQNRDKEKKLRFYAICMAVLVLYLLSLYCPCCPCFLPACPCFVPACPCFVHNH